MKKPVLLLSAIAGLAIIALVPVMSRSIVDARAHAKIAKSARPLLPGYRYIRSARPDRTAIYDRRDHLVAELTEGSSTVVFHGQTRTFTDPDFTSAVVRTDAWVRLAPSPWRFGQQQQAWFRTWFGEKVDDRSPDLFASAVRYLSGQPRDAGFGPPAQDPGDRVRGADWNDYLGVAWAGRRPRPRLSRDLDCSGYIRLVYGHDMGVRLFDDRSPHADGLGRLSRSMAAAAPGIEVADSRPHQLTDLRRLQPGDLVFFALHDNTKISHWDSSSASTSGDITDSCPHECERTARPSETPAARASWTETVTTLVICAPSAASDQSPRSASDTSKQALRALRGHVREQHVSIEEWGATL